MNCRKVSDEFFIAMILGGVPCYIAYDINGITGIENHLKAIDSSDSTFYYYLILAIVQVLFSLFGFWLPRYYEPVKRSLHSIYPILNQVGTSLICLYRILTGSIIMCAIIGVSYFPILGELKNSLLLSVLALPFLFGCVILNKGHSYATSKQV